MTDREKVTKGLESVLEWLSEGEDRKCVAAYRAVEDALELLKEQEPVKPTVSVDTWICSKCGHLLESQDLIDDKENPQVLVHELYQYCPNCGRAVKWG